MNIILILFRRWISGKKSVKSINPLQSVIQTSYDIVKTHGGEISINYEAGDGLDFNIPLV